MAHQSLRLLWQLTFNDCGEVSTEWVVITFFAAAATFLNASLPFAAQTEDMANSMHSSHSIVFPDAVTVAENCTASVSKTNRGSATVGSD